MGGVAWLALFVVLPLLTGSAVLADELPSPSLDNPCNPLEGQCDPPSGGSGDPLEQASEALENMSNDLVLNWFQAGVCAEVESDVPEITDYGDVIEAFQTLLIHVDGEAIGYGTVTVLTDPATGITDMEMVVTDGPVGVDGDPESGSGVNEQWTLRQTIWTSNGQVISYGTVEMFRVEPPEEVSYAGGWVYDLQNGPSEHPDSDAGFHAEVAAMFGCDSTVAGFGVGNTLNLIGNIASLVVYYIRDLFIPWSNPTSCSGPIIEDGVGQSCRNVNIPCKDSIADTAKKIGSLPGVSRAFKKCLKGRFACGGSSFPRLRVRCASSSSCGPCSYTIADGCNIGGSLLWYCPDVADHCYCVNVIFHEASHACGARDLDNGANYDAYRIGDWFEDQAAGCGSGNEILLGDESND
jgi:hypothetical protein